MSERLRFYVDEHIQNAVVKGLRLRGIEVVVPKDHDMLGASDIEHLRLAHSLGCVLISNDRDFIALGYSEQHSGVIVSKEAYSIGTVIRGIALVYDVYEAHDLAGRVEYL